MNRILNILVNPFFLSAIFTVVIILLLPPVFDKFNLELKQNSKLNWDASMFYFDLDGDGFSEQISYTNNEKGKSMIYLRNHSGKTISQWNFNDELVSRSRKIICDFDQTGYKKIFAFTRSNDSLFLNFIDPLGKKKYLLQNRFISRVSKYLGEYDFAISSTKFADINGDSIKELIFGISAGFAKFPRKVFIYDIKNNVLKESAECGNVINDFQIFDINQDGNPEIIVDSWAPRNYTDSSLNVKFSDTSGWLFVFKKDLDYYFDPISFNYSLGRINSIGISSDSGNYIISFAIVNGRTNFESSLFKINYNGEILKKVEVPKIESFVSARYGDFIYYKNQVIIASTEGRFFYYDKDLNFLNEKVFPGTEIIMPIIHQMDLNSDGQCEFLVKHLSQSGFTITDDNLKNPVMWNVDGHQGLEISKIELGNEPPRLFVKSGRQMWIFEYRKNPLFFWHYPIGIGIFLVIWFLNILIQKIQKNQIRKKFETQQQITELQLKTIRNQMEPHFTFNAINSIAAVIYDEKKEVAYNYFSKISKLIRQTLESSDKVSRTLEEELDFVKIYLEVQKFRFTDKFNFEISIEDHVNLNTIVPKMVLQTYAENAVKHGLVHRNSMGELKIDISQQNNSLICKIEDNGIGRAKAKEIGSKSTGKGVKIMQQYYDLFNKFNKTKIEHEIFDLFDVNGRATGTKVIIKIPV
ncbi:MAG: histidine kinase [Bacteroidales bacterium]|nr:histidine kinase [Bacteroidales bacterium]MCF8403255.1 histidine kinase [Bacteroidales bacterium]